MQNFESEMAKLINEFDPDKIDLSQKIYNFEEHEKVKINRFPLFLKIGNLKNNTLTLPALVPFLENKGITFQYGYTEEKNAILFIQNLILQIINRILPNKIAIIIYDPAFLGAHFSIISRLSSEQIQVDIVTNEERLQERFQEYIQQSEYFIKSKLAKYDGFADYWENSEDGEKEFILFFLNDSNFTRNLSVAEIIERISRNTRYNNSFFILAESTENVSNFSFFKSDFVIRNDNIFYHGLKLDLEYNSLLAKINISFTEIIDKQKQGAEKIESIEIKEGVKIPIGVNVSNNMIHFFKFGFGTDNYHAIIGGQSGKGKSVLLNTIIKKGIERYSEEDLQFLLFDCNGNEFSEFQGNPHIMDCQCTRDMNIIIEKLAILEDEFEKRTKLLQQHKSRKIEDLFEKGIKLSRIVCIIDEFQFLLNPANYKIAQFAEDILVTKIIRTGRKFGIHLIASTQSLGDLVRSSILANIPLRIALGMTKVQSSTFLAYNNYAASNLEKGQAIYNDGNGEKESNKLIRIFKIS